MKDVIVLGCGPAGLLAAHAVEVSGNRLYGIFSKKQPSYISGAQFLHRSIPDVTATAPDAIVEFSHHGTAEGYAEKVYGNPEAPTSWGIYQDGEHAIWSMQKAYDKLWGMFERRILNVELTAELVTSLVKANDLVISTVPLRSLCASRHEFSCQDVWITQKPAPPFLEMYIRYNGDPAVGHYRASNLFGTIGKEYSFLPYREESVQVKKPLSTNCDCFPGMLRTGRYGAWDKPKLIHHAYEETLDAL